MEFVTGQREAAGWEVPLGGSRADPHGAAQGCNELALGVWVRAYTHMAIGTSPFDLSLGHRAPQAWAPIRGAAPGKHV